MASSAPIASTPPSRTATHKSDRSDSTSYDPIRGVGTWLGVEATKTRQIRLDDETARSSAPFLDCLGAGEREAKVDIVFVHGLSGGKVSTWKSGDTFWPRDICQDFPEAQVLLLAYDSRIWTRSDHSAVRGTADDLLRLLSKARPGAGTSRRPLIWIAHSVGGCLVKTAYVRSKPETMKDIIEDELFPDDICRSTAGMIFFGTPHRTRSIGGWRSILSKIHSVAREYRDDVGTLRLSTHDEEDLLKALLSFELTLDKANLPIISFYEKHESFHDGVPALITSPDNALFYRNETISVLEGNHVTMPRFQSSDCASYRMVKKAVERFVAEESPPGRLGTEKVGSNARENGLPEFPLSRMEEDIQNLFNFKSNNASKPDDDDTATRLARSVVETFAPTVKLRRLERMIVAQSYRGKALGDVIYEKNTPQWILKTPDFEKWYQSGYLLVIQGPIGSGKSAAACALVRHLNSELRSQRIDARSQAVVLYHFARKIAEPRSAVLQMLHQFVLQLLEIFPQLGRHFPTDRIFLDRQRWPSENRQSSHLPMEERDRSYSRDGRFILHQDLVSPLFSSEELCEILVSALRDESISEATLVIDGLDESPGYKHNELENLLDMIKNVPGTKVCITASSSYKIYDDQENLDITSAADFQQHVDAFSLEQINVIRQHLFPSDRKPRCSKTSFRSLEKILSSQDHGSYLHIVLIQQVLNRLSDKSQIDNFIAAVTSAHAGPRQYYDRECIDTIMRWVLQFLNKDVSLEKTSAAWMLIIVSISVGPLTVSELRGFLAYFMAVAPGGPGKVPLPLPKKFTNIPTHAIEQLDLHEIADKSLFSLLTVQDGLVTAIHPFVNIFAVKYYASTLSALSAHMAVYCINLLGQFSLSSNAIEYDSNSLQHSVPVEQYRYPLRYWFTHVRRAGESCRGLWSLLQKLWAHVQLRQVILEFAGCALPLMTELPLSCLLAALDLDELLSDFLASSKSSKKEDSNKLSLEMRCAAANLSQSSLNVLIKHGYNPSGKDEAGLGITEYRNWARIHIQRRRIRISKFPLGNTPLSEAVRLKPALEEILKNRDNELNESLIASVRRCEVSIARGLLKLGASSGAVDNDDPRHQSALHIAASMGSFELVQLLLRSGAQKLAEDSDGIKPIHLAARHGHHGIVQLLVSLSGNKDANGRSPLFMACESSSLRTIQVLLKSGLNINLRDKKRRTPLHSAASVGSADVVQLVLTAGADVDAQDIAGVTPLHIAAWGGWRSVVTELLSGAASVNQRDHKGQTALHCACKSPNPSVEVVQVLLENLSNPDLVDNKGRTALHIAARSSPFAIVELLRSATSTVNQRYPLDKAKNSPLDLARRNDSKDVLKLFELSEHDDDGRISWSYGSQLPEGIDLDIVFVHLFRSTGSSSWAVPAVGNILGEDLKSSRFIEWNYDSGVTELPSIETFNKLAVCLLSDLSTFRKQDKIEEVMAQEHDSQPPIAFVGHSLAGLVIKSAVKIAAEDASWTDLSSRIKGCIFLGTPHQRSARQSLPEIVDQLADRFWEASSVWKDSMSPEMPYKKIIRRLKQDQDASAFSSLQRDFVKLSSRMQVLCVGETQLTHGNMLVPLESAFLSTSTNVPVEADHIGISKLLPRDGPIYSHLVYTLTSIASEARSEKNYHEKLESVFAAPFPTQDKALKKPTAYELSILRSLRSSSRDLDELVPRIHGEVLSSQLPSKGHHRASAVDSWAQNPLKTMLWISGKPGSGKSVLMRQLFHDEATTRMLCQSFKVHESNLVKAAFTFQHKRKFQSTAEDILLSLLYQILLAKHELISKIFHESNYAPDDIPDGRQANISWSKRKLETAFTDVFEASPEIKFCIYIDALDESADRSAEDISYIINRVGRHTENTKICVSSRPWNLFYDLFSRATTLHLHEVNFEDIREFVSSRIENSLLRRREQQRMIERVVEGASGSFLWARLVTEKIIAAARNGDSDWMVLKQINTFPRELQDTYEGMLDRISEQDLRKGWTIFQLVLSSNGFINAVMLSCALESTSGTDDEIEFHIPKEAEDLQDIQRRVSRRINCRCGGLLEVSDSGNVQFVHKTAEEFISTNPRYRQYLDENRGFHPYLVLMRGHILHLTNYSDRWGQNSTEQAVASAFENAKSVDNEANNTATYVRLFERLCRVSLGLYRSRQLRQCIPQPQAQDSGGPPMYSPVKLLVASSIPKLYQYCIFLAARLGLVRYLEGGRPDPLTEEKRYLVNEALSLAFNFENLDLIIPWASALSCLRDLPDPEAVRILLATSRQITTEDTASGSPRTDIWQKVLVAGYHCFGVRLPVGSGPNPTPKNKTRWIKIVEYFLRAGAMTNAEYAVTFSKRGAISSEAIADDMDEQIITPERAITENLASSSHEFDDSCEELLSLLKELKEHRELNAYKMAKWARAGSEACLMI